MTQCQAPAKVNLALAVTGLDARGYHLLDSVMYTVHTADRVALAPHGGDTHRMLCPQWLSADAGNTLFKAADALAPYGVGKVAFRVEKHIPVGAGMGGGSADAAAALRLLCKQYGLHLSQAELEQVGLGIGADVPFALRGGMARARGVGEKLDSLPALPHPLHLVWAMGQQGLSTPKIFRAYDEVGSDAHVEIPAFLDALYRLDFAGMRLYGGNDLQKAAMAQNDSIATLCARLEDLGAGYACMTGSGAAVFGIFATAAQAAHAQAALQAAGYQSAIA